MVVLGSAGLLWLWLPALVLDQIVREAKKSGVELSECEIALSRERILLSRCRVKTLEGLDAQGKVEAVAISLVDFKPTRADVTGAAFDVRSAPELHNILEYQPTSRAPIPVRVSNSRLSWYPDGSKAPLLVLSELSYETDHDQLDAQLSSPGLVAGTVSMNREVLSVHLALLSSPDTSFSAKLTHRGTPTGTAPLDAAGKRQNLGADLEIQLTELPAALLHVPLFLEIPEALKQTTIAAKANLVLPAGDRAGQPKGTLQLKLKGAALPIPAALSSLVHADETVVEANVVLDRSYSRMKLQNLSAKHGVLELKGSGNVAREGLGLALTSRLRGRLSCQAIAQAALNARLEPELAKLVSKIARKTLKGGVDIGVDLEAHTSKLAEARLTKLVGVGCGLKALSFDDAVELGEDVLNSLPDLGDLPLPELELPKLKPPTLPFPKIGLPLKEQPQRGDLVPGNPASSAGQGP